MTIWKQYEPELLTDLYELTMAASYLAEGMFEEATFSLFIREHPRRPYFVSAGAGASERDHPATAVQRFID